MTVQEFLKTSVKRLESAGVGTARLDCLVLLEDATCKDRAWLLAHPDLTVQGTSLYRLEEQVKLRAKHEPLAYIRGKTEFYGREFIINKDVLEPRPESETMIDLLKQIVNKEPVVIDIGTGSGALAITAKLELPKAEVIATDIDPKCLKIARQNARKHRIEIKFYQGNLMRPISSILHSPFSVLVCNLPYVPDSHTINQAAMNEPRHAIFGGPDGLDLYEKLFTQINNLETCPEFILTESLPFQHQALAKIAGTANYRQYLVSDFIQVFKNANRRT